MSKERVTLWLAAAVVAVCGLVGYMSYSYGRSLAPRPGTPVIQIEKLARLVPLKVTVSDILEARSGGDLLGVKGAWLVKGDALLSVDMSQAQTVSKDAAARKITLLLPKPTVFQPRVDHSKTVTYDVQKGLFVFGTGTESRLRDDAMRQAQMLVEQAAGSEETLQIARNVAEELVRAIYRSVDWEATVKWADEKAGEPAKENAGEEKK